MCSAEWAFAHFAEDDFEDALQIGCAVIVVRVRGVEPLSRPWEGHIIAVIRHPHRFCL